MILLKNEDALYREFLEACLVTDDGAKLDEAELSEGVREVFSFARQLAFSMGSKIQSVIKLLKDSEIFKFFASFKFDMAHLQKAMYLAMDSYKKIVHFLPDLATDLAEIGIHKISDTKQGQKIQAATNKINDWVKSHKAILAVSGIVLALLLIVIWVNMSTTGDPDYDFSFSDVVDAVTGKLTLVDFFNSREGIKSLILLAVGLLGFNPVRYFGNGINMVLAVVKTLADWKGITLLPGKDSQKEVDNALNAL